MKTNYGKWCLSTNGEEYDAYEFFDTKEEAIAYAKENEDYQHLDNMFVGKVAECYKPEIFADQIIDTMQADAYDSSPEWGEDYLDNV